MSGIEKELKLLAKVKSIRLTTTNMEEVERLCCGRIRGSKLPIQERVVQFDSPEPWGEQELSVGDVLVTFITPTKRMHQAWRFDWYIRCFGEIDEPRTHEND